MTEYGKFRDVKLAEPMDFDSAFFRQTGLNLQAAFEYKNPWGFTDIDALTEKNGYPLLIERKEPPVYIYQKGLTAQKKAIEGITRRLEGALGIVVWSDKGLEHIEAYRCCYHGEWEGLVNENPREKLQATIAQWGVLVMELGPLEKWDTKWYPKKR